MSMDTESLAAIRDAAIDYFTRSKSVQRSRILLEQSQAQESQSDAQAGAWRELAALGWPGMLAPEAVGGLDFDLTAAAQVLRAAGEHVAPEPLLAVAGLAATLLARLDTPAARELLAELAAGRLLPALAWQESAGELSAEPLSCGCEPDPDKVGHLVLQGDKTMVQPGPAASGWLASARDSEETVVLWVPRGTAGVEESIVTLVDGNRCSQLRFERVALPPSAVLGRGDRAEAALRRALAFAQILQAAELLGLGQALLARTRDYLCTRAQFGKPIGSYQAIKHQLADAWMGVDNARLAVLYAAAALDGGLPDTRFASGVAEYTAIEGALRSTRSAIQVHGGMGFTWEHDAHLYLKRAQHLCARLGGASGAIARVESLALAG